MSDAPVVDVEARRELAVLIRHLANGRLTAYEFDDIIEDEFPGSDDPAIWACIRAIDPLRFKLLNVRYRGKKRLSPRDRKYVAHVLLFLYSEEPYEHPVRSEFERGASIAGWVALNMFTLGLPQLCESLRMRGEGQIVRGSRLVVETFPWPFYSQRAFTRALQNPPFLCGAA